MRVVLALWLVAATASAQELRYALIERADLTAAMDRAENHNAARLETVRHLFDKAGCIPTEQRIKGQKLPNLICETSGPADALIVVGAHYDKVRDSSGVIDNWSGAAILAALYSAIKPSDTNPRAHKFVFIAFGEEEKGLIGSRYFVSKIKPSEVPNYHAMVNIDCLGLGPTSIWPHHSNKRLTALLGPVAAALQMKIGGINLDQVGRSDSFSFAERQIPTIDFHSITQETWPILHSRRDNRTAFHADAYWDSYRLLATYLAYLDQQLTPTAPR